MDRRLALAALALAPALAPGIASAAAEKKKGGGLSFIQIQALAVSIIRRSGGRGVMTMELGIDVPDESLRTRAQASVPRLRAACAQTLQIYASGLGAARAPDADYLAGRMQADVDQVLGKKGAKLLVGTILIN